MTVLPIKHFCSSRPPLSASFFLFVLTISLAGCFFPSASNPQVINNDNLLPEENSEIDIGLVLDQPITDEEKIIMEILDEVTGLPHNIQTLDLRSINDTEFRTKLSVPSGSVIKYRYAKINSLTNPETITRERSDRYRLAYANGYVSITDRLTSWEDEDPPVNLGFLAGKVFDEDTALPIPDIIVSAGGHLTFTDANGEYIFDGLPAGIHNVVFSSIDGRYHTYQQGARISPGSTTFANVSMKLMPSVKVTLNVTAPHDGYQGPIKIAGNISTLGNTFTNLVGSLSIKPSRMPTLSRLEDGTYQITLDLFTHADVRFKFSLGDGYWNAERNANGEFIIRQLIVPDHDVTLNLDIETWYSGGMAPITFQVSEPVDSATNETKYIQFNDDDWTVPIPLWTVSTGSYLYQLYSPLDPSKPLTYRICRDDQCQSAIDNQGNLPDEAIINPGNGHQTITTTLDQWVRSSSTDQSPAPVQASIPGKPASYAAMIELSPLMDPAWLTNFEGSITKIADLGANTVIFSPQWFTSPNGPIFSQSIGKSPFYYELSEMLKYPLDQGLARGLFPQILQSDDHLFLPDDKPHSDHWWDLWFTSYRRFTLNYAKLAQIQGVEYLLLGGKSVLPAFSNGAYPDGSESDVPQSNTESWQKLITDIRKEYTGNLIWVTNAGQTMDPLPGFIGKFDQILIIVDSPLSPESPNSIDEISANFNYIVDYLIYEVHRSTQKPIILAFGYPSVVGASHGCLLKDDLCTNDGLFLDQELSNYPFDANEQALIYNAIFPVTASRDWIQGILIRGFEPYLWHENPTSSINNKPAEEVIRYWFSGLLPE